jgi:hypothetical protein
MTDMIERMIVEPVGLGIWPGEFKPGIQHESEVQESFDVKLAGEEASEASLLAMDALNSFVQRYCETLEQADVIGQAYKQMQELYFINDAELTDAAETIQLFQVKLGDSQLELIQTVARKQQVQEEYLKQTDLVGVEKDILDHPEEVDQYDPNKAIAEVMLLEGFDPSTSIRSGQSVQEKKENAEAEYSQLCKRERELTMHIKQLHGKIQDVQIIRTTLHDTRDSLVEELTVQHRKRIAVLEQLKSFKLYADEPNTNEEDV